VTDCNDENITSLDSVDKHVQLPDQGLEYFIPWMYEKSYRVTVANYA